MSLDRMYRPLPAKGRNPEASPLAKAMDTDTTERKLHELSHFRTDYEQIVNGKKTTISAEEVREAVAKNSITSTYTLIETIRRGDSERVVDAAMRNLEERVNGGSESPDNLRRIIRVTDPEAVFGNDLVNMARQAIERLSQELRD